MLQIQYIYSDLHLSTLNITAEVNLVWQLGDVDLEPVLNLVEDLGVALVTDEGDGQTLGAESSCPGDPVEVGVRVLRHVVVEHDVDSLNVHSTTKQIGGNQNSLLEILELLIPGNSTQNECLGSA